MSDNQVVVKLLVQNSQYLKQLNKSAEAMKSFGNTTKTSSAFMAQFGGFFTAQAVLGGIKSLGKSLYSVAKVSVSTAASYELQRQAFGNLLQDVARGNELFEELKNFAATTPLQLDDITVGTQKLLAFGVANETVIETMERLGNLALGQSDKLSSLTNAYGKLKAKGRATLEELNLFTENGVPLMDALANTLGVATSEVFALVSAGKVGFDEVNMAIESLTSNGGRFEGMMADASTTLTGKWSTFKDVMSQLGAGLVNNTIPAMKTMLDFATEMASIKIDQIRIDDIVGGADTTVEDLALINNEIVRIEHALNSMQNAYNSGWQDTGVVEDLQARLVALQMSNNELVKTAHANKEIVRYQQLGADKIARDKAAQEELNALLFEANSIYATTDTGKAEEKLSVLEAQRATLQEVINTAYSGTEIELSVVSKAIAARDELNKKIIETTDAMNAVPVVDVPTPKSDDLIAWEEVVAHMTEAKMTEAELLLARVDSYRDAGADILLLEEYKTQELKRLADEAATQEKESLMQRVQMYAKFGQQVYGQMMGLFSNIGALQDNMAQSELNRHQAEIDDYTQKKDERIELYIAEGLSKQEAEEKYNEALDALQNKKAAKEDALKRRQFEQTKATKIADVVMSGGMGVANAWTQAATLPPPAIIPFGVGMTAFLGGITAANVGLIASQQYPGLFEGGIVPAQGEAGGLYRLGDKHAAEVVLPLDRLADFMPALSVSSGGGATVIKNYYITVQGFVGDEVELAIKIREMMERAERTGALDAA